MFFETLFHSSRAIECHHTEVSTMKFIFGQSQRVANIWRLLIDGLARTQEAEIWQTAYCAAR